MFLAWLLFVILDISEHRKILSKGLEQREALVTGLVEFHKVQCFFSMALQIASLFARVFHTNLLNAYMLLPLSMNGILPVLFAFLLFVQYGRASVYLTVLTGSSWLLATIVFWGSYLSMRRNLNGTSEGTLDMQFVLRLSANPACGGYFAQTVCAYEYPIHSLGRADLANTFMPLVWLSGSLFFFMRLFGSTSISNGHPAIPFGFVISLAIQFYLFGTNVKIELMNVHSWGFGQIIGVTVWFAPVIVYVYLLLSKLTLV